MVPHYLRVTTILRSIDIRFISQDYVTLVIDSNYSPEILTSVHIMPSPTLTMLPVAQASQLSRFGHETHDFSIGLTTACSSHDFSRFYRNIINMR